MNVTQPANPRVSTAQENVQVLAQSQQMPGLDRSRQIRLYLPPGYDIETDYYPVLYMHDGQNLFDDATSFVGEWKVDETLNRLANSHNLKIIVVGIDNGADKRMTELSAWDNQEFGAGEGKQYLAFITDVVKPYIDSHYRTKADISHTAIMGSSMGGLMSFYAIYSRPDVFSKAAIYSPSFWYSQQSFLLVKDNLLPETARLDFVMGTDEGDGMVEDMQKMLGLIKQSGHPTANIRSKIVTDAQHNEAFWASEFADSVLWLFNQ